MAVFSTGGTRGCSRQPGGGAVAELGLAPPSSNSSLDTLLCTLATAPEILGLKKAPGLKATRERSVGSEAVMHHHGKAQECRELHHDTLRMVQGDSECPMWEFIELQDHVTYRPAGEASAWNA